MASVKIDKNFIGSVFGGWTVIQCANGKLIGNESRWLCRCICGVEKIVLRSSLRRGKSKSCGCLSKSRLIDETGNKYGKLTVLCKSNKNVDKNIFWECVCDCGKTTIVRANALRRGYTKSCGCLIKLPFGESAFNSVFNGYRQRAKRKKLDWDLSKVDFAILTKNDCFYCGKKPANVGKGRNGEYIYNGIDRIDNNKGYILVNLVSCCAFCNFAKKDKTAENFLLWIKTVYNKHFAQ